MKLTDTQIACGVTVEQVRQLLDRAYVSPNIVVVMIDNVGPALAGAIASNASNSPVEYRGLNSDGHLVYDRMR